MTTIDMRDITIHDDEGGILAYRTEELGHLIGEDAGRLLIRFQVDGNITLIEKDLSQTGDLAAIDLAITELTRLRGHLVSMLGDSAHLGRCLEFGDWGRCYGTHQHDDEHSFPSESDWRSLSNVPSETTVQA